MTQNASQLVDKFLRGNSTHHIETIRDTWRALMQCRESAVPEVQKRLSSKAWKDNPRGPLPRYFGALLALLDELDPVVFRQETCRLKRIKLHPIHRRTLDILAKRLDDQPAIVLSDNTPIFISDDIVDRARVIKDLTKWSRTKGVTLEQVTRIDVIARRADRDYLGKYNLFFSYIVLTWPSPSPKGLRLWWARITAEFTFYHEVGHHVLGHGEGGQVAAQEKEANEFASSMLRNSRPVFVLSGRAIIWPFKPLLRRLLKRSGRHRA